MSGIVQKVISGEALEGVKVRLFNRLRQGDPPPPERSNEISNYEQLMVRLPELRGASLVWWGGKSFSYNNYFYIFSQNSVTKKPMGNWRYPQGISTSGGERIMFNIPGLINTIVGSCTIPNEKKEEIERDLKNKTALKAWHKLGARPNLTQAQLREIVKILL